MRCEMQGHDRRSGDEDTRVSREVLAFFLREGPKHQVPAETRDRWGGQEQVERVIEALVADDLLVRADAGIAPTPAAIRYDELRAGPTAARPAGLPR